MSEPSSNSQTYKWDCNWKNGLKIEKNDQIVYQNTNPIIIGLTTTVAGMVIGAGIGFAAPFYGTGRLLYLGGRTALIKKL